MREVYAARRAKLMEGMKAPSIAVIYSGTAPMRSADEEYEFSVDRNFYYYTGIDREHMILILKKLKEGTMAEELYIEPFDEVMAKWVGARMRENEAREISGIEKICYLEAFDGNFNSLIESSRSSKKLTVALDLWKYKVTQAPTQAHLLAARIKEQYPAVEIRDIYADFVGQRIKKEDIEIEKMMVAQHTTQKAIEELMRYVKPGMNECEMEGAFDFALRKQGVREHAFPSIVAGGVRATTLHYKENNQEVKDGELVLIDLGSANEHYCADISRTFPVNGKFTARQKEIYDLVLSAQDLIIEKAAPGMTLRELNQMVIDHYAARLDELGLAKDGKTVADYYYHGVSHQLGLDTHDISCSDYEVLEPGMVITVEPGFYIEEDLLEQVDGLLEQADVKSRNEFLNQALKFYIGYLTSEKIENYMLSTISSVMHSTVKDSENRMARAMYKLAVETSKLSHVIAYSHGVDEEALRKLQAKCAEEVKRINGTVSFESAYEYQKG